MIRPYGQVTDRRMHRDQTKGEIPFWLKLSISKLHGSALCRVPGILQISNQCNEGERNPPEAERVV